MTEPEEDPVLAEVKKIHGDDIEIKSIKITEEQGQEAIDAMFRAYADRRYAKWLKAEIAALASGSRNSPFLAMVGMLVAQGRHNPSGNFAKISRKCGFFDAMDGALVQKADNVVSLKVVSRPERKAS